MTNLALEEKDYQVIDPVELEQQVQEHKTTPTKYSTEQAFYATSFTDQVEATKNKVDTFRSIKEDLETKGYSQDLQEVKNLIQTETNASKKEAMIGIISDPNTEEEFKQAAIGTYLKDRELDINLSEEYLNNIIAQSPEVSDDNREMDINFIFDRLEFADKQAAEVNKTHAAFDASTFGSFVGFLQVMVPFYDGFGAQKVKEAITQQDEGWFDTVTNILLSGETKVDIRNTLDKMPPEERIQAVQRGLEAINNLPGQDLPKHYLIMDTIADPEYATWQRALDDFVGILDATILGGAAIKIAKSALRVHPSSPLAKTAAADRAEAANMAARAVVDDSGEAANAVGATRTDIVSDYTLPRWDDEVIENLPTDVSRRIEEIEKTGKDIYSQISTHGINYYEFEKEAARTAIKEGLDEAEGLILHQNKSTFNDVGERYFGEAIYGRTAEKGFDNVVDALEAGVDAGYRNEEITLYKNNPAENRLELVVDFEREFGQKGEYFTSTKFDHVYSAEDVARFGLDAVSKWGNGKYGDYFFDVVSRFDRLVSRASLRAQDLASSVEKRLLDIVRQDLTHLNNKGKARVFSALEEGAREEKVYSRAQLANTFEMTEREIRSYYSYRKVSDLLWTMTNRDLKRQLDAKGMQWVKVADMEDTIYAKPIKEAGNVSHRYVFDPASGEIKILSDEELETLYKSGGSIGKLDQGVVISGSKVDQIIVNNTAAQWNKLPDQVLNYLDGYFQRSYKEYYFVRKVPKELVVNGVKLSDPVILKNSHATTLGAYGSKTEADKMAAKLGEGHIVELGKEFADNIIQDYQIYQRNIKTARHRGEHLQGVGGYAKIEDPVESLFRTVRTVSNRVGYADLMESMIKRWENTFGHLTEGRAFPTDPKLIDKAFAKSPREYRNAVALQKHIKSMERIPSTFDKSYQNMMLSIAESFEGKSLKTAELVRGLGEIRPTTAVRKLPSTFFIALRPLRQVLLQSGQLMQLTFLDPKYVASGLAARELTALSLARATHGTKMNKSAMKAGAKIFGVSEKDYKVIVDTYMFKSGLPFSVDANWYVEGLVKDIHKSTLNAPPLTKAWRTTTEVASKGVALSKRVGFDIGEFANITGSWLMARRRWLQRNPELAHKWMDKQYADIIAADAREISYAMTQPGTFGYQKGLLSIPLQFVAVPHKALLSVTTSKQFTKADKAKIIAANLTLFGGYAFGLNKLYDAIQEEVGFELDEDTLTFLKGGTLDLGLNALIRSMADDEDDGTNIQFSKAFSPFSEGLVPASDIFTSFLDGDFAKVAFGPSYNLLHFRKGRFAKAIQEISSITKSSALDTDEKVIGWVAAIGSIPSGVSDYMKMRVAQKTGYIVSTNGDPVVKATASEALAKLFGLQTYQEDEAYKILRSISNDQKELKDYATWVNDSLNRVRTFYFSDPTQFNQMVETIQVLNASLSEDEMSMVTDHLMKLQRKDMQTVGESVISSIISTAMHGGEIREEMLNKVRALAIPEDAKKQLIRLIELSEED